jgi:hypothetical protein
MIVELQTRDDELGSLLRCSNCKPSHMRSLAERLASAMLRLAPLTEACDERDRAYVAMVYLRRALSELLSGAELSEDIVRRRQSCTAAQFSVREAMRLLKGKETHTT